MDAPAPTPQNDYGRRFVGDGPTDFHIHDGADDGADDGAAASPADIDRIHALAAEMLAKPTHG